MNTYTVKVERTLSADFLSSVLITAFDGNYGGCWYWCSPYGDDWLKTDDDDWTNVQIALDEETGIPVVDSHSHFNADHLVVRNGIQMIMSGDLIDDSIKAYVVAGVLEDDAGNIDSIAADCIIQVGIFGKVVFG